MAGQRRAARDGDAGTGRDERIEFRTTVECHAWSIVPSASATNLTDSQSASLVTTAQSIKIDRDRFELPDPAAAEWQAINAPPARDVPSLRRLLQRPSSVNRGSEHAMR